MSQSPPFVDRESRTLQTDQIWTEAFPLVGLMLLFGAIALIPYVLLTIGVPPFIQTVLVLLMQFILLVGSGIVLMYIIARGMQLSNG